MSPCDDERGPEEPTKWGELIGEVSGQMAAPELTLLLRVAEAEGRRVPVAELSAALGLPASPELERDFPALSKFVSEREAAGQTLRMPVVTGGAGEEGWYWVSVDDAYELVEPLRGERKTVSAE